MVKKKFTIADFAEFCRITGDTNPIHDASYMLQFGKQPIGPGMLTLAYAANQAENALIQGVNTADIVFGTPVAPDEPLDFGSNIRNNPDNNGRLEVRLTGMSQSGKDVLADPKDDSKYSRFMILSELDYDPMVDISGRSYQVREENVAKFNEIINGDFGSVSETLYAIASGSWALCQSVRDAPDTDVEKAINQAMLGNPKKKQLPMYTGINLLLGNGFNEISGEDLVYSSDMKYDGKRKIEGELYCSQGGKGLFKMNYGLALVPEKLIIRAAKKL